MSPEKLVLQAEPSPWSGGGADVSLDVVTVTIQLAATPVPGQGHVHRQHCLPLTALHHGVCL